MFICITAMGKPSMHLMSKTMHVRGIWGVYEVPLFDELHVSSAINDTICQLVKPEWIKLHGSVYVDLYTEMVYITRNDSGLTDAKSFRGESHIDYHKIIQHICLSYPIEHSFLVKIERMK